MAALSPFTRMVGEARAQVYLTAADGRALSADWTRDQGAAPLLYTVIGHKIIQARRDARRTADARPPEHPRHGAAPQHDDVVAQLIFGTGPDGGGRGA